MPVLFHPVREGVVGCRVRAGVNAVNNIPEPGSAAPGLWNEQMDLYGCLPAMPGSAWLLEGPNTQGEHIWLALQDTSAPGGRVHPPLYFRRMDMIDLHGHHPGVPRTDPPSTTGLLPAPTTELTPARAPVR
jgi:hypothetical protein